MHNLSVLQQRQQASGHFFNMQQSKSQNDENVAVK